LTYEGRVETAEIRGSCPAGYMELKGTPAPPSPEFRCVYDGYSSDPVVARVGTSYPFSLGSMHCTVEPQQFDHALFIIGGDGYITQQVTGFGTMTLVDPYHARYVDRSGGVLTFVAISSVRVPPCL
jgi:hypothetical protein